MPLIMEGKESAGGMKVPPGTYEVTCLNVSPETLKLNDGGTSEVIRFDMITEDIYDPEGNPAEMDAIASAKLTPRSKLTGWVTAFGLEFQVGKSVDIEDCIGRKALVKVAKKIDASGKDTGFTKVDDIMSLNNRAQDKNLDEMTVEEWWAAIRSVGIETKDAIKKANEMFSKHPKDLTGGERKEVYEAF